MNKVWAEHELEGKWISLSATHPFYKHLPTVQPSLCHLLWIGKSGAALVSERPSVAADRDDRDHQVENNDPVQSKEITYEKEE